MNPIEPPAGRVHDRQSMKNAESDLERAASALRAAGGSLEFEPEGRAAFHMLRGAIKATAAASETMQSILRNAIHRDNAGPVIDNETVADIADVSPLYAVSPEFLGHLKIVVDFTTANRITKREADEKPYLLPDFQKQDAAVSFLTKYLEAHSDEGA